MLRPSIASVVPSEFHFLSCFLLLQVSLTSVKCMHIVYYACFLLPLAPAGLNSFLHRCGHNALSSLAFIDPSHVINTSPRCCGGVPILCEWLGRIHLVIVLFLSSSPLWLIVMQPRCYMDSNSVRFYTYSQPRSACFAVNVKPLKYEQRHNYNILI